MACNVIRKEKISSTVMSPRIDSPMYRETTYEGFAWMCGGCGLVWEKRWHAEKCAERGHVSRFSQMYCDGTVNGKPVNARYFERYALRRDPISVRA